MMATARAWTCRLALPPSTWMNDVVTGLVTMASIAFASPA